MAEITNFEIKKKSSEILAGFAKSISSVNIRKKDLKEGLGGFRKEGKAGVASEEFRQRMFENAPHSEGDFIIAEVKKW